MTLAGCDAFAGRISEVDAQNFAAVSDNEVRLGATILGTA
jgi:hypothetical protein